MAGRRADRASVTPAGGSAYHAPRPAWLRPGCSRRLVRRSCPAPA